MADDVSSAVVAGMEANLRNLREEQKKYTEQIEAYKKIIVMKQREHDLRESLKPRVYECRERLDPKFGFEKDARFLEIQAQLDVLGIDVKLFDLEQEIDRFNTMIANANVELERIGKAIPEAEDKLIAARGE